MTDLSGDDRALTVEPNVIVEPALVRAARPRDPSARFFICDDHGGYTWTGVARDRDHFVMLLRKHGATWEIEDDEGRCGDANIDQAIEFNQVEVRELGEDEFAREQRCDTADERGVIPLSEAAIGDLFCSEW